MKDQLVRFGWTGGALLLLLAFWDTLVGFVLHLLFYIVEFLELWLEHTLEFLFELEGHEAQMFTAWIGFTLFMALGGYAYYWGSRLLRARFQSWSGFFAWLTELTRKNWIVLSLLTSVYLASLFLF